jgi:Kinesin motor domain
MVIVPASPLLTPSKIQENNLTSSTGSIRVFARIRPFIENEKINRLTNLSIVHSGSNTSHSLVTPQRGNVFLNQAETPLIRNFSRSQHALSSSRTPNLVSNHTLFLPNDAIPNTIVAKRVGMTRDFTCNAAFNYDASQKDVYDKSIGQSIRNNIFNGNNTTIFAYGQKNSGKTFTMLGRREADISNLVNHESHSFINFESDNLKTSFSNEYFIHEDDGVIPRAIHDLFKAKQRKDLIGDISIKMNVIEMHNDELKDLLIDKDNSELKVRDVGDDGFLIEGLTHVDLKSAKHARDVISRALRRKQSIEKKIAIRPSSSHTICQFIVTMKTLPSDNGITRKKQFLTSKLTMVDLAASDSINKFDLDKRDSRRESVSINKDLFVLGKVLAAIADNSFTSRTNHIPFRDSKLTMVLSDSLRSKCDINCSQLFRRTNKLVRRKM